MGIVSQKLRDSAKGQECTLRTEYCNHDPATTVLAHLPSPVKSMGNKGNDWHAVFACSACHEALDQHNLRSFETRYCLQALEETQRIWVDMGLLSVPVTEPKPRKPSSKILPRRSMVAP